MGCTASRAATGIWMPRNWLSTLSRSGRRSTRGPSTVPSRPSSTTSTRSRIPGRTAGHRWTKGKKAGTARRSNVSPQPWPMMKSPSCRVPGGSSLKHATLHETPPGATHWSCRSMAKAAGVSRSTIQRIWDAHGLQPHRVTTFKLSKDPAFVEKLTDVVGLHLNPPDKAVVLCVDEKSQIQALDRTQPGLPMERHHDPRLQTPRHDDAVRRVERADRQGHRPMPRPPSASGIPEVPAAPRPHVSARPHPARHPRQLRDPQARSRSPVAGRPPALPAAL